LPRFQLLPEDILHEAAHDARGCLLHIQCDMGVGVQRERRIGVTQNAGKGLGIYTDSESVSCEGVAQIVKANTGQTRPTDQRLHVEVSRTRN